MAGRGRKVWTEETLAVPDLQDYLQDQTVMVFTNSADRSAQIPAPTEGMVSYLLDQDAAYVYTGAAWQRLAPADGPLCRVLRNAAGSSATAAFTPITWDANPLPSAGMYPGSGVDLIATRTGYWRVSAGVSFAATAGGRRLFQVMKNGAATFIGQSVPGGNVPDTGANCSGMITLAVGDKVRVDAYQDSGATQNTINNAWSPTFLELEWLRPL